MVFQFQYGAIRREYLEAKYINEQCFNSSMVRLGDYMSIYPNPKKIACFNSSMVRLGVIFLFSVFWNFK